MFAVETNWPGSLPLNDYVLGGEGDPVKLMEGLSFWTVDTEEVLELVRWMRHHNADPRHARKLKFQGYANGNPAQAAKVVLDYLREVDPGHVAEVEALVGPLTRQKAYWKDYAQRSPEDKARLRAGLEGMLRRFDAKRAEYAARTGEARWRVVRHHARVLGQVEEDLRVKRMARMRDWHMAENVLWMLEEEPGARVVLSGHNGHITFAPLPAEPMGWHLRQRLGQGYLAMGLLFNQGRFHAVKQQATPPDKALPRHAFEVGPSPEGLLEHVLAQVGPPAFVVDLRSAPAPAGEWLQVGWQMRGIGAAYHPEGEAEYRNVFIPSEAYDALFCVDRSSPIRALPR